MPLQSVSKKGFREHPQSSSSNTPWLSAIAPPVRPDELERKRTVEAGGAVILKVRKTKSRRADESLIKRAEKARPFFYICDPVRYTPYTPSPSLNPAKRPKT